MPDSEITRKLAALEMWKTGVVVFLVIFCVSITSVQVYLAFQLGGQAGRIEAVAAQTHDALCAFKEDLVQRQRTARQYLKDVNAGRREAVPGITTAEIAQAIANRQSTLDSLASLDCN